MCSKDFSHKGCQQIVKVEKAGRAIFRTARFLLFRKHIGLGSFCQVR